MAKPKSPPPLQTWTVTTPTTPVTVTADDIDISEIGTLSFANGITVTLAFAPSQWFSVRREPDLDENPVE